MPLPVTALIAQSEVAFGRLGNLRQLWQDTADNFYPERATFTTTKIPGESFASNLYDSNPIIMRRDFGDWIGATIRPKGRPWFGFRARDEKVNARQRVKVFLTDRAETTRNLMYDDRSQFVPSMKEADHDYVTFGNSVMSVEDREDKQGLLYRCWHLGDCAWEDNPDGVTHKMFRRYRMTAENLKLRSKILGWKVPERILRMCDDKQGHVEINCMHIVMPADLYDMPTKKRRGMEWVSLNISVDEGQKAIMSEAMRPVFNYSVSRWFKLSQSPYAFSPAVCCSLPDARTVQSMTWAIIEAGEKAVEPPLVAVREAILGGVELYAGGVTWVDGKFDQRMGDALKALELGKEPQLGVAMRELIMKVMGDAWYINKLFLPPPANQPMTAEEVSARTAEFLRVSQPVIEPAETERNGKIIDITVELAQYLGYWGDPDEMPEELAGRDVGIAYDNPVEDARKLAKTQAYGQLVQLAESSMAVDQTLPANIDWQTAFREAAQGVAPPKWILPEEKGKKAVVGAQQQQQVKAAAEQIGQAATVAADVNQKNAMADKAAAEAQQVQPAA